MITFAEDKRKTVAVNDLANRKGLTAVELPHYCGVSWALVDEKGLIKNWVDFVVTHKIDKYVSVDLGLWRSGRALSKDTGLTFVVIVLCGDDVYYLAAPFATWEFGVNQDTLVPAAYVSTKFLVHSSQVEMQS